MKKTVPPAKEVALRLLARRDHSRQELRQKLLLRRIASTEAEGVLGDLAARGVLDDARYARKAALYLGGEKLLGPRRVREKLSQKGIPPDLLAEAEKDAEREFPAEERLKILSRKKLKNRNLDELSPPEQRRLARFLYQRGFSWGHIREFFQKAGGWFEE